MNKSGINYLSRGLKTKTQINGQMKYATKNRNLSNIFQTQFFLTLTDFCLDNEFLSVCQWPSSVFPPLAPWQQPLPLSPLTLYFKPLHLLFARPILEANRHFGFRIWYTEENDWPRLCRQGCSQSAEWNCWDKHWKIFEAKVKRQITESEGLPFTITSVLPLQTLSYQCLNPVSWIQLK